MLKMECLHPINSDVYKFLKRIIKKYKGWALSEVFIPTSKTVLESL